MLKLKQEISVLKQENHLLRCRLLRLEAGFRARISAIRRELAATPEAMYNVYQKPLKRTH